MLLQSLVVRNFRSLESASLEGIGQFNVLIGRNNAGKSTVFNALKFLADVVFQPQGTFPPANDVSILTGQDSERQLGFGLVFTLRDEDRSELVELFIKDGYAESRREALINSPFARQVSFAFLAPPGEPTGLRLQESRMRMEDGKCSLILGVDNGIKNSQGYFSIAGMRDKAAQHPEKPLTSGWIGLGTESGGNYSSKFSLSTRDNDVSQFRQQPDLWIYWRLARYFDDAFFFSAFRHGPERHAAEANDRLTPEGANLPAVLNFLSGDDPPKFRAIESFLQTALPDIGSLRAGLIREHGAAPGNQSVRVALVDPGNYQIGLQEMGGGVEQLLMTGVALVTTNACSTIFLEEPESHLHSGAQRHLMEEFRRGERQIFLTTHSPVFLNSRHPVTVFRVSRTNGQTSISRIGRPEELAALLEEIDARNSDVLLSDAVLFVEGPTDAKILAKWGRELGVGFEDRNITVLLMGGGRHTERHAPVRSHILEAITKRAQIPHLFIIDRDERSEAEIGTLKNNLGDRLWVLERREIENYLLIPQAILSAIRDKHRNDANVLQSISSSTEEDVNRLIQDALDGLYGLVLLKRLKAAIGSLRDGLLPLEAVLELRSYVRDASLPERVQAAIEGAVSTHISNLDIPLIVESERESFDRAWAMPERRSFLAPGAEVLSTVYERLGSNYDKRIDGPSIAGYMVAADVPPEIHTLMDRIGGLQQEPTK